MKIKAHWRRHVEAWRESGLSQAAYCHQQDLNHKTFSVWTRRVQVDLSLDKDSRTKRSQVACDSRLHFSEKLRQKNHAEFNVHNQSAIMKTICGYK